ncbi:GMC oxidoreductase [Rhizoctonia solani]|uniref:GMC oxidoreductase n=1 Tax=Rhizoctonia solani TaxID=456999 RepID=A0A8H8P284_9AGAM|nr:GMC oxidoreductase [Rhizoctonia solani]QRW23253.1 GMC oxidoreductase [Rhizoctonia solani]
MTHSVASVALVASAVAFLGANALVRTDTASNPNNPHRRLLTRAVTADPTQLSGKSFDFVIVGGGTAGLAIAARLSEYSNMTVAVIEAGGDGSSHADNINIPGYSYIHGLTGTDADWSYDITAQPSAGNRVTKWPRGKVLGGSGSINGMFWGIGAQREWDAWATLFPTSSSSYNSSTLENGTPASFNWSWSMIQKYHKKSENFTAPPAEQQTQFGMTIDADSHGYGGAIQTTMSQYIYDGIANWVPTLVALGMSKGDLASGDTHVVSITPSTLNAHNFTRSNSMAGYIDPVGPRSNLVILTGMQATGLVWGDKGSSGAIATGVKFAASNGAQSYTVKAKKEVILCGGTIGSAQLLQLSGVGPKALMTSLISTQWWIYLASGRTSRIMVRALLRDFFFRATHKTEIGSTTVAWAVDGATWWDLLSNDTLQAQQLTQWRDDATGLWTYINEAVAYPSIQDIMGTNAGTWLNTVSSGLSSALSSLSTSQSLDTTVLKGITQQFNIQLDMLKNSVGQLEIIMTMLAGAGMLAFKLPSSTHGVVVPSQLPAPMHLTTLASIRWDVDIINAGIKYVRTIGATAPMSSYFKAETSTTSASTTDDAINTYIANSVATEYHPIGTCSMLPLDMGGVVDTTLRVYGTSNVRVIDASVMPIHVTAHTMAPAYAIAEYGADIIKMAYWPVPVSTTTTSARGGATNGSGSGNGSSGGNNGNGSNDEGGLTSSQRTIVIAATVAVGGAALLLGLLFCIRKRSHQKPQGPEDPWRSSYGGAHSLPMQNLSNAELAAPPAPFKAGGNKYDYRMSAMSSSTMDTAQLQAATPLAEHQPLAYDHAVPPSPGFAYNTPGASAPGTPHMGPAPGLMAHDYAPVNGRASPGPRI